MSNKVSIETMIDTLRFKAENIKTHIEPEFFSNVADVLEKQVAKKPEVWANGTKHCPCCEKDVTNLYFKVCVECGQRLKEGD